MEEYLLINYHLGRLEGQERDAVKSWLETSAQNQAIYAQCIQIWQHAEASAALQSVDVEGDLATVKAQIGQETAPSSRKTGSRTWLWRIAALLVIGVGLTWTYLEFGAPEAPVEMLTLETGETVGKPVLLADGSQVVLNAHSKFTYPAHFNGDERQVTLSGAAWFKVNADPEHPFVIRHGGSQTEVLGTEFNVNAYPNAPQVHVSVNEGVVRLGSSSNPSEGIQLIKGQVGEFANGQAVLLDAVGQNLNLDAWRTQILSFDNAPLKKVIRVLQDHYSVNITVKDSNRFGNCKFSGKMESITMEEAMEMLALTFGADIQVKGKEITILHVNC